MAKLRFRRARSTLRTDFRSGSWFVVPALVFAGLIVAGLVDLGRFVYWYFLLAAVLALVGIYRMIVGPVVVVTRFQIRWKREHNSAISRDAGHAGRSDITNLRVYEEAGVSWIELTSSNRHEPVRVAVDLSTSPTEAELAIKRLLKI